MSAATKNPPIRIRRATVTPIKAEKPKGPATTPSRPRPPLVKVENPQRLRKGSKEHRKLGGLVVCSPAWSSPFRTREMNGRWFVVWTGDEMRLAEFKPDGWKNIPCENRIEAANLPWKRSGIGSPLLHQPACSITPERS